MLDPQVAVNLLPAPGVVDERSCCERTKWPSEGSPKGGTQVLAVCVAPGQLDDRWRCSNTASSPLCVRVAVDFVIT
jgi:hypothetical protein